MKRGPQVLGKVGQTLSGSPVLTYVLTGHNTLNGEREEGKKRIGKP